MRRKQPTTKVGYPGEERQEAKSTQGAPSVASREPTEADRVGESDNEDVSIICNTRRRIGQG